MVDSVVSGVYQFFAIENFDIEFRASTLKLLRRHRFRCTSTSHSSLSFRAKGGKRIKKPRKLHAFKDFKPHKRQPSCYARADCGIVGPCSRTRIRTSSHPMKTVFSLQPERSISSAHIASISHRRGKFPATFCRHISPRVRLRGHGNFYAYRRHNRSNPACITHPPPNTPYPRWIDEG